MMFDPLRYKIPDLSEFCCVEISFAPLTAIMVMFVAVELICPDTVMSWVIITTLLLPFAIAFLSPEASLTSVGDALPPPVAPAPYPHAEGAQ